MDAVHLAVRDLAHDLIADADRARLGFPRIPISPTRARRLLAAAAAVPTANEDEAAQVRATVAIVDRWLATDPEEPRTCAPSRVPADEARALVARLSRRLRPGDDDGPPPGWEV